VAGDPHGPNKFSSYIETHETIMGRFVDGGFVIEDTLNIYPVGARLVVITGSLPCLGDIRLDVRKLLRFVSEVEGPNELVQTVEYNYNASLDIGNIVRYDSPHPDHNQFHHVHRFNVFDGDHIGEVSACAWPTLGDVIGELEGWYYDNYHRLYPSEPL
jgi:hypothetical protein